DVAQVHGLAGGGLLSASLHRWEPRGAPLADGYLAHLLHIAKLADGAKGIRVPATSDPPAWRRYVGLVQSSRHLIQRNPEHLQRDRVNLNLDLTREPAGHLSLRNPVKLL